MKKKIAVFILIFGMAFVAGNVYAGAMMADEAPEPAQDPKKKKAGEECKASDECQNHHTCKKTGDKGICTAPERPKLPPGVVTQLIEFR
ncbi:MAG: hypothetical protein J0L53_04950 [Spirochaetes bacterium]|nr:hypothetical protein [Spirochaetota bacterium]MBX3722099.1 hypothetical protein [Turneriella sp.]